MINALSPPGLKVTDLISNKCLVVQKIKRIIYSEEFNQVYCEEEDYGVVQQCIDQENYYGLIRWMNTKLLRDEYMAVWPIRHLRQRAKNLGVQYYSYLSRESLLSAITNKQKEKENSNGTSIDHNPGSS